MERGDGVKKDFSIVVVGISGYGEEYLKELIALKKEKCINGVVDTQPQKSKYYNWLISKNIPIYKRLEQYYKYHTADLALISTPIHYHKDQSILALENHSNVLCEKPITSSIKEVEDLITNQKKIKNKLA